MDSNPPRPIDAFIKRSMGALQKEYLVIGKTRISSFTAWAVIAFFIGVTIAVAFLASRSGTLEGSSAARAPRPVWSSWSKAKEGNCEGKTSATQQCRSANVRNTVIEGGKRKRVTVAGFQTRSCQKNCESLAGAQFQQQRQQQQQASDTDQIKVDYRYIRDYFIPQVTGLSVHREIKSNMICNDAKVGCGILSPNNETLTTPAVKDLTNKYYIFYIPRVAGTYRLGFLYGIELASAKVYAFGQVCPADSLQKCNFKETKLDGGKLYFPHIAGQDQIIKLDGFDADTYDSVLEHGAAWLTGKQSVQYLPYDGPAFPGDPFLSIASWITWAAFVDDSIKAFNEFPNLITQMFPNAKLAFNNCAMVFHTNVSAGSPLANALDLTVAQFQKIVPFFHLTLVHGDGVSWADFPKTLDHTGKDTLNNGTNYLAISTDPNQKLFKDNGQSTGNPNLAEGYIEARELYGPNFSGGNNLIATFPTSISFGVLAPHFDPNNPDHMKEFSMLMMHAWWEIVHGRDQKDFEFTPYDPQANKFFFPPSLYRLAKNTYQCAASAPSSAPTCTINGPVTVTPGQDFAVEWYASGDETSAAVSWDNNSFTPPRLKSDNTFVGSGTSNTDAWNQKWQNVHKNADDKPSKVTVTVTGPGGSSQCSYQVSTQASACKAIPPGQVGDACHSTLSIEQ